MDLPRDEEPIEEHQFLSIREAVASKQHGGRDKAEIFSSAGGKNPVQKNGKKWVAAHLYTDLISLFTVLAANRGRSC